MFDLKSVLKTKCSGFLTASDFKYKYRGCTEIWKHLVKFMFENKCLF